MDYKDISQNARNRVPSFQTIASAIAYEEKGTLYSEMLFMLACMERQNVRRILESGRARGQSTLLLARALPHTEIISIEFDEHSPDVTVAQKRLEDCKNATLLFGDARVILPGLVKVGDVVLIDGPKMFRAIRLALALLATKKVVQVFVHDMGPGTHERNFLDAYLPESRFSDSRMIAEITSVVDGSAQKVIPPHQRLDGFDGEYGYGFTLACIPYVPGRSYRWLLLMAILYDVRMRLMRLR